MTLDRRGFAAPPIDVLEALPDGTYRAWVAGVAFTVRSPEDRTWVVDWTIANVPPTRLNAEEVQRRLAILLGGTVVFQEPA